MSKNKFKLGELADITSSKRIFFSEYVPEGIPFYRSKEIIEKFNNESVSTELFITRKRFDEIKKKYGVPQKGDILLTSVGTLGVPCLIENEEEFYFKDGNLTWFRDIKKNSVLSQYLYYWLISRQGKQKLIESSIGSTQQALTIDGLKNIEIELPPINDQDIIVKILSELDDKIEINNHMNKTLESIAQAIFKRWFVDFEFPYKNGKPYNSSGGKMVDSELGEIPDGWIVNEISDCGEVVCGKTPPTVAKDNYGEDIFFITIPDMRGRAFVIKTERKLSNKGASTQNKKELPTLAICVSCIATPGLVSLTSAPSHTNQQINSIVCNNNISPFFMYYTMLNKSDEIKSMGLGGTATLNLNTGNFARIKIVVPEKTIMDAFHKIVAPSMEKILSNLKENESLCSIRDSLLPRLMLGKIRVN